MKNLILNVFISSLVLHGTICHARIDTTITKENQLSKQLTTKKTKALRSDKKNKTFLDKILESLFPDKETADSHIDVTDVPTLGTDRVQSTSLLNVTPTTAGATISIPDLPQKKPTTPRIVLIKSKPNKTREKTITGAPHTSRLPKTPPLSSKFIIIKAGDRTASVAPANFSKPEISIAPQTQDSTIKRFEKGSSIIPSGRIKTNPVSDTDAEDIGNKEHHHSTDLSGHSPQKKSSVTPAPATIPPAAPAPGMIPPAAAPGMTPPPPPTPFSFPENKRKRKKAPMSLGDMLNNAFANGAPTLNSSAGPSNEKKTIPPRKKTLLEELKDALERKKTTRKAPPTTDAQKTGNMGTEPTQAKLDTTFDEAAFLGKNLNTSPATPSSTDPGRTLRITTIAENKFSNLTKEEVEKRLAKGKGLKKGDEGYLSSMDEIDLNKRLEELNNPAYEFREKSKQGLRRMADTSNNGVETFSPVKVFRLRKTKNSVLLADPAIQREYARQSAKSQKMTEKATAPSNPPANTEAEEFKEENDVTAPEKEPETTAVSPAAAKPAKVKLTTRTLLGPDMPDMIERIRSENTSKKREKRHICGLTFFILAEKSNTIQEKWESFCEFSEEDAIESLSETLITDLGKEHQKVFIEFLKATYSDLDIIIEHKDLEEQEKLAQLLEGRFQPKTPTTKKEASKIEPERLTNLENHFGKDFQAKREAARARAQDSAAKRERELKRKEKPQPRTDTSDDEMPPANPTAPKIKETRKIALQELLNRRPQPRTDTSDDEMPPANPTQKTKDIVLQELINRRPQLRTNTSDDEETPPLIRQIPTQEINLGAAMAKRRAALGGDDSDDDDDEFMD